MYKKIENQANGVKYRDVRVFESNNNTCFLEASLLNYELEEVLLAIKHVFDVELIKKEPRNE